MTEPIQILQRSFEDAANKFPGLRHTIAQQSKDGCNPESTVLDAEYDYGEPGAHYYVHHWSIRISAWHFLSGPHAKRSTIADAECLALALAEEAGKCLVDLPELKGLTIDDPAERWFLALHRIYPCTKWAYDPPSGPKRPNIEEPGTWREAEPGEAYVEKLDNVFIKSAMLCGRLLDSTKKPKRGQPLKKAFTKALAEDASLINNSPEGTRGQAFYLGIYSL